MQSVLLKTLFTFDKIRISHQSSKTKTAFNSYLIIY